MATKNAKLVSLKINLSKIEKERLYKSDKTGNIYLDAQVWVNDEADQYGNHGMITQQVTQEERKAGTKGAILGNARIISGSGGGTETAPTNGNAAPGNVKPEEVADDLPF